MIFYGWYIVLAGLLLMICNGAINIYGFTAFIDPIAKEFGWSYAQISLATSLRGIETGALNPLVGFLVDRWPARKMVLAGVILYGLGLLLLSRVNSMWMFYGSFLVIGLGSSLGVHMVPQTAVVRWFKKDVGKATGILFMGNGIGGVLIPALVMMIDRFGWKSTLAILGVCLFLLGIPLSFVFRTRPEEYGLLPDGGRMKDGAPDPVYSGPEDSGKTIGEALKMREFWQLGLGTMLQTTGLAAAITHIMPYFSSIGLDRSVGGMAAMGVPLVSLAARIPLGWLSDIYDKRYVRTITIGLSSVGLFLLWLIDSTTPGLTILYIIVMSVGSGGLMPTLLPLYRTYFGTKRFGAILGLANGFLTIGIIAGPPIAGWVYDRLGDFDPIWLALSIAGAAAALITATLPPISGNRKP